MCDVFLHEKKSATLLGKTPPYSLVALKLYSSFIIKKWYMTAKKKNVGLIFTLLFCSLSSMCS